MAGLSAACFAWTKKNRALPEKLPRSFQHSEQLGYVSSSIILFFISASALPGSFQSRKQKCQNIMTNAVLVVPAWQQVIAEISLKHLFAPLVCKTEPGISQSAVVHMPAPFQALIVPLALLPFILG